MTKSGDEHSDSDDKLPVAKQATRSKRRNKPKDFPKRPLSAYNVFFKETREDILAKSKENDEQKVDFQTMAKEIAARWKTLGKNERDRVERLAQKDMLRYRDEVKAYEEEMVKKSRSQREAAAAEKELSSKRSALEAVAARSPETLDSERSVMERLSASVALGGGRLPGIPEAASLSLAGLGQGSSSSPATSLAQRSLLMHDHSQQSEMLQRQILLEQLRAVEAREIQLRRLQNLSMLQQQGESSLAFSAAAAGLTQLRPGAAGAPGLGSLMGGSVGASMFGLGAPAPGGLSGGGDLGHVYAQLREQALMNALMARGNNNGDFQLNQK